jgi:hypothetical protein
MFFKNKFYNLGEHLIGTPDVLCPFLGDLGFRPKGLMEEVVLSYIFWGF